MKDHFKGQVLEKREALKEPVVKELSECIVKNLSVLDEYTKARVVMYYVSFKKEVFTHKLIEGSFPVKRVVVPKIVENEIVPSLILSLDQLMEGYGGILEPIEPLPIAHKDVDLVIVPGVVFDKRGHRIGYRQGHYDKFLKKLKAVKVGLAYDFQMVDKIPEEPHDVPMDFVVTEKRTYNCRAQK